VCARVGGCAAASGRRRGLGCGLLGAVVLLQEVPMQALERAEGWATLASMHRDDV